jgi:hypothetical protein
MQIDDMVSNQRKNSELKMKARVRVDTDKVVSVPAGPEPNFFLTGTKNEWSRLCLGESDSKMYFRYCTFRDFFSLNGHHIQDFGNPLHLVTGQYLPS